MYTRALYQNGACSAARPLYPTGYCVCAEVRPEHPVSDQARLAPDWDVLASVTCWLHDQVVHVALCISLYR